MKLPLQLKNFSRTEKLAVQAYGFGLLVATLLMAQLLLTWATVGEPSPPAMEPIRFSVAMLSGEKSSAQAAPENTAEVVEDVTPTKNTSAPLAAAEHKTSLPEAVSAAPESSASTATAMPVEVTPPARVSMPGGQLKAEDAAVGEVSDPFAIGPRQVFIRLLVDETGKVVRAGIVRSGGDPMRDALILKSLRSRTYASSNQHKGMLKVDEGTAKWQLDMVIPYGTNDFLP